MTSTSRARSSSRRRLALTCAAAAGELLLRTGAAADPGAVTPPTIPGTPALAGAVVDPGKPAENMKTLKTTPDVAKAGTAVTLKGSGLPANKDVTIVWMTASIRYV